MVGSVIVSGMTISIQIEHMSRKEKLQTMEALWVDLSRDDADVESPTWHNNVLKETAARVAEGTEQIAEWTTAKKILRKQFE